MHAVLWGCFPVAIPRFTGRSKHVPIPAAHLGRQWCCRVGLHMHGVAMACSLRGWVQGERRLCHALLRLPLVCLRRSWVVAAGGGGLRQAKKVHQ